MVIGGDRASVDDKRAASAGGPLVVEAEAGRLSGKLLILRLTALGM